VFIQVIVIDDW